MRPTKFSQIEKTVLVNLSIFQPVSKSELAEHSQKTVELLDISNKVYLRAVSRLIRSDLLWRTEDDKYMLTPNGSKVALRLISRVERDKLRFYYLNQIR